MGGSREIKGHQDKGKVRIGAITKGRVKDLVNPEDGVCIESSCDEEKLVWMTTERLGYSTDDAVDRGACEELKRRG